MRERGSVVVVGERILGVTEKRVESFVAFGTDAPWLTPPESIRREIRLLEEAGKLADLIVLDGDTLEDVSALLRIEVVVKGGEVVASDRAEASVE